MAVTAPVAGSAGGANGGTVSPAITAGMGPVADDIVVAYAIFYANSGTVPTAITWPSGITNLNDFTEGRTAQIKDASGNVKGIAGWAWARATGNVSTPTTLSISSNGTTGANSGSLGQCFRIRGCITGEDPWEDEQVNNPNYTSTVDWPAATMNRSTGGGSVIILCNSDNVNVGTPANWTVLASNASSQGLDSGMDSDYRLPGATGTYDPANGSMGANNELGWATFHIIFTDTAGGTAHSMAGTAAGSSSVTGAAQADFVLAGVANGVASSTGAVALAFELAGTASGAGTGTGALTVTTGGAAHSMAGAADGVATSTGSIALSFEMAGTSNGVSSVTGVLPLAAVLSGTSAGASIVTGYMTNEWIMAGTVNGDSTSTGTLLVIEFGASDNSTSANFAEVYYLLIRKR